MRTNRVVPIKIGTAMTLTIKETTEPGRPATQGSSSSVADKNRAQSARANPRVLEMPVTVRSLPGENGAGSGSGPIREEGKTVIVFDNGAVLRLWNNLPPGQKLILSNALGNDVVCRVVSGRNLPNVQGYIEVDFIEAFSDFWGVQQGANAPAVAPPVASVVEMPPPAAAPMQAQPRGSQINPPAPPPVPAPVAPSPRAAAPVAPSAPRSEREVANRPGGAPTFDDVAGLLRMSPPPVHPAPVPFDIDQNRSVLAQPRPDPLNSGAVADAPVAIADVIPVKKTVAPSPEFSPAPRRAPTFSSDLDSRGLLHSAASSAAVTSEQRRSRIGLIIGAVALLAAGFGGGYFFMHQQGTPAPAASVAVQPAAPPPAVQTSDAQPPQESAQVADRSELERPAVSVSAPAPAPAIREAPPAAGSNAASQRAAADATKAEQAELQQKQREQMTNLKMSSPSAPKPAPAKLSPATPDVASLSAPAIGAPAMTALSSMVRPEGQPAPPPAPAPKVVSKPTLISSTKPVYPASVRSMNIQGNVTVTADLDASGNVVFAKAISGPVLLREAASDAVKHWKYSPGLIDGKAVASEVTVVVQFSLQ